MRTNLARAKARFSEIVEIAVNEEPVIVTKHGEPVAVVMALPEDQDDRERFLLMYNPVFQRILRHSRESGDPVPHDEFWEAIARRRRLRPVR